MINIKLLLFLFVSSILISACSNEDESYEFGQDFADNTVLMGMVDTMKINTYTVLFDSIATSGQNTIFVGSLNDEYLGKVSAETYLPLIPNISNWYPDSETRFDSLVLVLTQNGEYSGDTNELSYLNVYELNEEIETFDNGYLYNNSSFEYNAIPIGSHSFKNRPLTEKQVFVRLPNSLGETWLNWIVDNDERISDSYEFLKEFKGICIAPSEKNQYNTFGFYGQSESTETEIIDDSKQAQIRLYYTLPNQDDNLYAEFNIESANKMFVHAEANRNETLLKNLATDGTKLSTSITNNLGFVQGLTGIGLKVEIPGIKRIVEWGENISILDAELIIKPHKNSFSDDYPLPTYFNMYWTDKKNRLNEPLYDITQTSVINSYLSIDKQFDEGTYYSINILDYVWKQLEEEEFSDEALMVTIPYEQFSTSLKRLVVDSQDANTNSMQLKIYYLRY